jgi:AraC family ethanolamine operon transcriptional activator
LCDRRIAARIESESLEMLIASLLPPDKDAKMAERRRAALSARRHMVLNMEQLPTITDICRAVHATERTLHLGFREAFGITPKRFLKALRLNAVRRALLNADSESTAAELAGRLGFFHLSNFTADYCRMFGELPSKTLTGLRDALERETAANC